MRETLPGEAGRGREAPVVELRRPWRSRLSAGHLFVVVAGVLAFALNLAVLQRSADTMPVAVAASDIPAGTLLAPSLVTFADVAADSDLAAVLYRSDQLEPLFGSVVVHSMVAGEPFTSSVLKPVAARAGLRAMSIPVDVEHAAGGRITPGDTIDVVAVGDGGASIVARDLEVLDVADRESGGIGGPGAYFVVVAVDLDSSLALAEAMANTHIDLLLATGGGG